MTFLGAASTITNERKGQESLVVRWPNCLQQCLLELEKAARQSLRRGHTVSECQDRGGEGLVFMYSYYHERKEMKRK